MENWVENKKVHDAEWGMLYAYCMANAAKYTNIKEEWANLFSFEMGHPLTLRYISEGKHKINGKEGYFKSKNKHLQNRIDKYITPTTDAILDLGAGWGRHSIQLAFNNPDYNIISGELSDTGKAILEYFIEKYDLSITIVDFNWHDHKSIIDFLSQQFSYDEGKTWSNFKEIIIFTSNAIEQIPNIKLEFFTDLLSLPIKKISAIHIEPVKFQYDNADFPFSEENAHYNRNLKTVLDSLVSLGLIKIKDVIPLYWGHSLNIASQNNTLIEWVKLL
tara:strand:- start:1624 stop:2448 length:825 start_codon:yes stop_codon:yes gene_type:complete